MNNKVLPFLISKNRVQYPGKIAIVDGRKQISYSDLYNNINKLSDSLSSLGIQKGDRVMLLLQNSSEFVMSFFAIAGIGAIAVLLNDQYQKQELAACLSDSDPKVIITFKEKIPLVKEVSSTIKKKDCLIISVSEEENEYLPFRHLIERNFPYEDAAPPLPEDSVVCQYTSGSTGKQKRIIRSHLNLISEVENLNATLHTEDNEKILCAVPLFHAHGLGNCMLASIYTGATLVILKKFNPHEVLKTIQKEQVAIFPGVPFMFSILADTFLKDNKPLSLLRLCFSAGAPLPQKTFQKYLAKYNIPIRQLYGSTETGSVSINLNTDIMDTMDSVGLPMRNVEVEIFDKNGEILPPNKIGSIGIKSEAMTKGYVKQENLNNGYFFPMDLGRKDERGNLYITGRKSSFINNGGNKVDPSEVETILRAYPKIREAVVVETKNYYGESIIKAVVVPDSPCNEREIVEFCKGKIANFKIPRIIDFKEEIPKDSLGKVLKKYLC
jgi:long-chain acyl-CoA synthetase